MSIFIYFFIGLMALFGIGWLLIAIATVVIQLLCDLIRLMATRIGYAVVDSYDLIKARKERRFAAAMPTTTRTTYPIGDDVLKDEPHYMVWGR